MRLRWLFLLLLACCSSNPAAAPAPLAELPSAIQFPSTVAIDVETVNSQPATGLMKLLVGPGGPLSQEIALGPDVVRETNEIVDDFLGFLSQLVIPVSTNTTTFIADHPSEPGQIKIDFASIDADLDGLDDGCSGHTADLPICFRVWVSDSSGLFERLMLGRFDSFPAIDDPGTGQFRIRARTPEPVFIGILYDQSFPTIKNLEQYTLFLPEEPPLTPEDIPNLDGVTHLSHHLVASQFGPDASAIKNVKQSTELTPESFFKYIGQWKEGAGFWSGLLDVSGEFESPFVSDLPFPTCARISTGEQVSRAECLNLSIDVEGQSFIQFLTLQNVRFPADFPNLPTF